MVPTILAWSALGSAMLFVVVMLVALVAGSSLGAQGMAAAFWIGVGMLTLAILLAIAVLVLSLMSSRSEMSSKPESDS
ncbi:MAG: hypothetical protein ACKO4T_13810 [Planctomycetaceae bacterium]